jgi:hypothetical protein
MNIFLYCTGGTLHKYYIEFSISGVIMVDEHEKDKVTSDMSKLISKFLNNKHVIKLENEFEKIDEDDFASSLIEVAEA